MVIPLQVDEEETVGEGDLLGGVVVLLEVREELAAFVDALKPGEVLYSSFGGDFKLYSEMQISIKEVG